MIKSLPWLIFLLSPFVMMAQDFIVTQSKVSYYVDGSPVVAGLPVDRNQHVVIRKKGSLSIRYKKRWSFFLKPGHYSLDSVFTVGMEAVEFRKNDSIYTVLETRGLADCIFNYKFREKMDGSVRGTEIVDNIKVDHSFLTTPYDTITVHWKNPEPYDGQYYVVIYTLFEDMIDVHETNANFALLELNKYREQKTILYRIVAEDCRASETNAIKRGYKD